MHESFALGQTGFQGADWTKQQQLLAVPRRQLVVSRQQRLWQQYFSQCRPKANFGKPEKWSKERMASITLWPRNQAHTGKRQWQTWMKWTTNKNMLGAIWELFASLQFAKLWGLRWLQRVCTCDVHELGQECEIWGELRTLAQLAKPNAQVQIRSRLSV